MNYRESLVTLARQGYRNLVGLITISVATSFAFVPIGASVLVGTSLAVLAGLWATCLLLGVVVVAAFDFTTTVADRGVPVPVLPSFAMAVRSPQTGLKLGALAFVITVVAVGLSGVAPAAYRPFAIGISWFLVVTWFLITAFAAPELGSRQPLSTALRASADRLGRSPGRALWFVALTLVSMLIAGITVITLVLFFPGVLALLAAGITAEIDASSDS